MGTIHSLIGAKGKRAALDVASGDRERRAIEAAAAYMAEEQSEIAFLFSGWAHAALPHRRIPDDALWRVETEHVTLLVEPGRRPLPGGENAWVGVPYGSRARLIMLYLQSEALRTNSRHVGLGRSLSDWLGRLGIPLGGKSYRNVRSRPAGSVAVVELPHPDRRPHWPDQPEHPRHRYVCRRQQRPGQPVRGNRQTARELFSAIEETSGSDRGVAISAINNNSMALDVYCWLAYRLHVLNKPKDGQLAGIAGAIFPQRQAPVPLPGPLQRQPCPRPGSLSGRSGGRERARSDAVPKFSADRPETSASVGQLRRQHRKSPTVSQPLGLIYNGDPSCLEGNHNSPLRNWVFS